MEVTGMVPKEDSAVFSSQNNAVLKYPNNKKFGGKWLNCTHCFFKSLIWNNYDN